jgi:predicted MFS family arabinose efflux permease
MALAALASRPSIGRWMDVRSRRFVILAGSALEIVVCLAYLTVRTVGPWLAAIRVVHGIAEAALFASLFTYAADIVPASRRTEGIALFGISGLLPMSLSGIIGDWILSWGDYRHLFWAAAGVSTLGLCVALPLPEPARSTEGPAARSFFASARQPDLLPLWFVGGSFAMVLAAVFTFFKTYVLETRIGSVGSFFGVYSGAAVVLRLAFAWVPERIGPKRALFPAIGSLALGLLLLATARSSGSILLAAALGGLGHGFAFPILSGLVVTRARPAERGAAISLFTAVFDLGSLLGAPLFGMLVEFIGYPSMYASAAAVAAAGAGVFAIWDRRAA